MGKYGYSLFPPHTYLAGECVGNTDQTRVAVHSGEVYGVGGQEKGRCRDPAAQQRTCMQLSLNIGDC